MHFDYAPLHSSWVLSDYCHAVYWSWVLVLSCITHIYIILCYDICPAASRKDLPSHGNSTGQNAAVLGNSYRGAIKPLLEEGSFFEHMMTLVHVKTAESP